MYHYTSGDVQVDKTFKTIHGSTSRSHMLWFSALVTLPPMTNTLLSQKLTCACIFLFLNLLRELFCLMLSNHYDHNLFSVMIIVIIIIALGNSRNSTSSFNPQLGVQEQRWYALHDPGQRDPSSRKRSRRTREASERKRWGRHGTHCKCSQ